MIKLFSICSILMLSYVTDSIQNDQPVIYEFSNAKVSFKSVAPLETITATSKQIKGLVNFTNNTFAIIIELESFNGFNSPLQREHFNENYVESDLFPTATYKGKIIEPVDMNFVGDVSIRTKGVLEIHGEKVEHIVPVKLTLTENKIKLYSDFSVSLSDYKIDIPRIVRNKISEKVQVKVDAELSLYEQIED